MSDEESTNPPARGRPQTSTTPQAEHYKSWKARNPERYREYQRAYHRKLRENNPEKLREYYETQYQRGNVKRSALYKGRREQQ